jgi:hypothetical protein
VLPSGDVGVAGLVAARCAAVATVAVRPVWPPKILNVISLALFTALAVAGFTEQFARQSTPKAYRGSSPC